MDYNSSDVSGYVGLIRSASILVMDIPKNELEMLGSCFDMQTADFTNDTSLRHSSITCMMWYFGHPAQTYLQRFFFCFCLGL